MNYGYVAFDGKCARCAEPLPDDDGDMSMDNQDNTSAESVDIEALLFGDDSGDETVEEDVYEEEPSTPECDFCGLEIDESAEECPRCHTSFVYENSYCEDDKKKGKKKKDDEDDSEDDSEDDGEKKMPAFLKKKDEAKEDDSEDDSEEDSEDDSEDDSKDGKKKMLYDRRKKVESRFEKEVVDPIDEASFYINMATMLGEDVAKEIASHIVWEANSTDVDAPKWLPAEYVEDWNTGVEIGRPKNFLSALSCFRGVIGSR